MKTVFFDVDTQLDFVSPAGALYVPGGERIIPVVARLNQHAGRHGIPVVSTTDSHAENDPEFRQWPPHCVGGTLGQRKASATLLEKQAVVPNLPARLDLAPQIILQKQALDCFSNVNLPALLEMLDAHEYVVYGLVTEFCVRCAVEGLVRTGKPVTVVRDAIRSLSETGTSQTLQQFSDWGVRLLTSGEITA